MAKQVKIMAVIDDDWDLSELNREVNDALTKHGVVLYVEEVTVEQENYDTGVLVEDKALKELGAVSAEVLKEYVDEFAYGNTDGFDEGELTVIKKFLADIVLYDQNRGST